MQYRYVGDGPFPQIVIKHGIEVTEKNQVVESVEPINHPHFVLVETVKQKKQSSEGAE